MIMDDNGSIPLLCAVFLFLWILHSEAAKELSFGRLWLRAWWQARLVLYATVEVQISADSIVMGTCNYTQFDHVWSQVQSRAMVSFREDIFFWHPRLKLNRTFREIIVYNDDHVYPEYIVKASHARLFCTRQKLCSAATTTILDAR